MKNYPFTLRQAKVEDANVLSALALRSKAYWGYSSEFIEHCREELRVHASLLTDPNYHYAVAESADAIIGYYGLSDSGQGLFDLEALFVEPEWIGKGVGKALMRDAINYLQQHNAQVLEIQGDPGAEPFYQALGAVRVGETESGSIPGRFLPQLVLRLSSQNGSHH